MSAAGFIATAVVFLVILVSKFTHGAWMLIPTVALLVIVMRLLKHHYQKLDGLLSLEAAPVPQVLPDKTMVVLVADVNRLALYGLRFAQSLRPAHLRAVHVALSEEEGARVILDWNRHVKDVSLDVVVSEYRDIAATTVEYLKGVEAQWDNDTIVVVIPELVPPRFWQGIFHNQTATRIGFEITQDPDLNVEILDIPMKASQR